MHGWLFCLFVGGIWCAAKTNVQTIMLKEVTAMIPAFSCFCFCAAAFLLGTLF